MTHTIYFLAGFALVVGILVGGSLPRGIPWLREEQARIRARYGGRCLARMDKAATEREEMQLYRTFLWVRWEAGFIEGCSRDQRYFGIGVVALAGLFAFLAML